MNGGRHRALHKLSVQTWFSLGFGQFWLTKSLQEQRGENYRRNHDQPRVCVAESLELRMQLKPFKL